MANFLSSFYHVYCGLEIVRTLHDEDTGRLRLIGDEGGRIMRVDLLAWGDRAAAFAGPIMLERSCLV